MVATFQDADNAAVGGTDSDPSYLSVAESPAIFQRPALCLAMARGDFYLRHRKSQWRLMCPSVALPPAGRGTNLYSIDPYIIDLLGTFIEWHPSLSATLYADETTTSRTNLTQRGNSGIHGAQWLIQEYYGGNTMYDCKHKAAASYINWFLGMLKGRSGSDQKDAKIALSTMLHDMRMNNCSSCAGRSNCHELDAALKAVFEADQPPRFAANDTTVGPLIMKKELAKRNRLIRPFGR